MQVAEGKVVKLQRDLTFYINKASQLEHMGKQQTTLNNNVRESHEDSKMSMSKSMKHRTKNTGSPLKNHLT